MQSVGLETSKAAKGSNKPFPNFVSASAGCTSATYFEEQFIPQISDKLDGVFLLFVKAIIALTAILIFKENFRFQSISFSPSQVPIYLRLGKLIYYN